MCTCSNLSKCVFDIVLTPFILSTLRAWILTHPHQTHTHTHNSPFTPPPTPLGYRTSIWPVASVQAHQAIKRIESESSNQSLPFSDTRVHAHTHKPARPLANTRPCRHTQPRPDHQDPGSSGLTEQSKPPLKMDHFRQDILTGLHIIRALALPAVEHTAIKECV